MTENRNPKKNDSGRDTKLIKVYTNNKKPLYIRNFLPLSDNTIFIIIKK